MKPEHASLFARIEQFQFDAPNTGEAFVRRLARENGWSIAYARRASEEYKRFAFLAITADHACTPSDQIDQVWHLHLIHTQQYWQRFCGEALGAPLHHTPSRGGLTEALKFRVWYARTLRTYRTLFGAEPPRDIWPALEARFATRAQRIDRDAFWLVPKPGGRARRAALLALAATITSFTLAGCALIHAVPPFDMRGPQFLEFFVSAWLGCFMLAAGLRRLARRGPILALRIGALDAYETAFLAGGSDLAAHAIIATLVETGVLQVDKDSKRLGARAHPAPLAHPLGLDVFRYCLEAAGGASPGALRKLVETNGGRLAEKLEQGGLIVPRAQSTRWRWLVLLAPALGAIKVAVGVAFAKPVGFLIVLCVVATLISLAVFGKYPVRTTAGDAELERLRQSAQAATGSPGVPIAVAVALFGVAILANTALADLGALLSPSNGSDGGGCGGGGCGGGGCGGCGGCGG